MVLQHEFEDIDNQQLAHLCGELDGNLHALAAALAEPKTAQLKGHFGALGVTSALIIGGAEIDTNFARAAANIAHVDVLPQQGANVYDILRRDTLVLTRDAVKHLEERLQ